MTVGEFINTKYINKNVPGIGVARIARICQRLGIKAVDGSTVRHSNSELSKESIQKILCSKELNSIMINKSIIDLNSFVSKSLESKIQTYKDMKKNPNLSEEDKINIDSIIERIESEKSEHDEKVSNIKEQEKLSTDEIEIDFEGSLNDILNNSELSRAESLDARTKKAEERIITESEYLNSLKSSEFASKFMQRKTEVRIQKTKAKISKLRQKQGVLQAKQKRIINAGKEKYLEAKQKEMNYISKRADMESSYIDEKTARNNLVSVNEKDIEMLKSQVEALSQSGRLIDKFKALGIKGNIKSLEAKNVIEGVKAKKSEIKHKITSTSMTYAEKAMKIAHKVERLGVIKGTVDLRTQICVETKLEESFAM